MTTNSTIHQPNALVFEMFDHLFAVASGQCIYTGAPYNVVPFLFEVGLKCPAFHNPADYCKYSLLFCCLFVF